MCTSSITYLFPPDEESRCIVSRFLHLLAFIFKIFIDCYSDNVNKNPPFHLKFECCNDSVMIPYVNESKIFETRLDSNQTERTHVS